MLVCWKIYKREIKWWFVLKGKYKNYDILDDGKGGSHSSVPAAMTVKHKCGHRHRGKDRTDGEGLQGDGHRQQPV